MRKIPLLFGYLISQVCLKLRTHVLYTVGGNGSFVNILISHASETFKLSIIILNIIIIIHNIYSLNRNCGNRNTSNNLKTPSFTTCSAYKIPLLSGLKNQIDRNKILNTAVKNLLRFTFTFALYPEPTFCFSYCHVRLKYRNMQFKMNLYFNGELCVQE